MGWANVQPASTGLADPEGPNLRLSGTGVATNPGLRTMKQTHGLTRPVY